MTMTLLRPDRIRIAGVAAAAALVWLTPAAHAQQSFNSPDDAAAALASAVKSGVRQDIIKVLGSNIDLCPECTDELHQWLENE